MGLLPPHTENGTYDAIFYVYRTNNGLYLFQYLLRKALYRENLANSSDSLTTWRPRATALLMSSSEERAAFLCRPSLTLSLNQASPEGCRRAARMNLLQRFLSRKYDNH